MAACIIFCAGEFDALAEPIQPDDFIIAADGGLRHLEALGIQPDEILGDFDSLGYTPADSRVYPVRKDDTDAMLAIRRGLSLGYRSFLLYGGMDGPRPDHTLANYQALQFLASRGAWGYLIGKSYIATVIKNGALVFPPTEDGILSVFALGPDAAGVTLRGLSYPLTDATLTSGFPLGVSNHFTGRVAEITVREGSLLVLWEKSKAGIPRREAIEQYEEFGLPRRGEASGTNSHRDN